MPDFTVLEGGGEPDNLQVCQVCGSGYCHDCFILRRYMKWLDECGRRPNTMYARRKALERLAAALDVPLLSATHADLAAWRSSLTVSDQSILSYWTHITGFYKWLAAEGIRTDVPTLRVPLPPPRRYVPRPIGENDLWRALDAAPARVRPWIVLGSQCGLRAVEVALLKRGSVHESDPQPYLLVAGDATKGGNSPGRVIPLTGFVIGELAPWLTGPPDSYVFPRGDGHPGPNRAWLISKRCNEVLRKLGIDATYHACRHRCATMAYRHTRDIMAVRSLLGHASVATTQLYTLVDDEAVIAAVNAIPAPEREVNARRGKEIVSRLPVPPKLRVVKDDSA